MSVPCCCNAESSVPHGQANTGGQSKPSGFAGRCVSIAQWIVPSAVLALMPKCPACVAAYIALATGIGISLPAATLIRTTLGVLCVASLLFLLARSMLRKFLRMTMPFRA